MKVSLSFILCLFFSYSYSQGTSKASPNVTDTGKVEDIKSDTALLKSIEKNTETLTKPTVDEINGLTKIKEAIEDEIKAIKHDRNKALAERQSEIAEKEKKLSGVKEQITSLQEQYNKQKAALDDLKRRTQDLKQNADSLQDVVRKLDTSKNKLQAVSDSLKNDYQQKLSTYISELAKKEAEIAKKETELAKKDDSLSVIAKIRLEDVAVEVNKKRKKNFAIDPERIYDIDKGSKENFLSAKDSLAKKDTVEINLANIKEVRINVSEGLINEIIVKTDIGVFRNKKAPIDIVHLGERWEDKLYREGTDSARYIFLKQVISYTPIRSYGDLPYAQFDITLTRDSSNREYEIKESTSINSYFDVSVFTDVKGISGDANGLAQITANAKFITNTRNAANKALIFSNYVSFYGGLSKFDNDFKGTPILNGDSINRKDLFQRSNYSLGLKYNVLHWVKSPYPQRLIQDIQLNVGYNFIGSKVLNTYFKDSAKTAMDTIVSTVTHNQIYIEPMIGFSRHRNFNMTIGLPFFVQNLKASSGIANREWEFWACPAITLMYYSGRESRNKLFFRYNHFVNLSNTKQAFTQMQLGYSVNITELLSSKK